MFSQILNMSLTGSAVILFVLLVRLFLKRSPKFFSYALWSVVLFRLLCPVSLSAPVSLLEVFQPEVQEASQVTSVVYYLPAEENQTSDFTFVPAQEMDGSQEAGETKKDSLDLMSAASWVWIAGIMVMTLCSAVQYVNLRRKLVGAMVYKDNVYLADYIDSPFVMGFVRPRIYLPSSVPMKERKFIIAHERHHIRRCDHVIKLLAYGALCIHWFNPLVWAAFILAGKDMEMSCDEAVIKKLGSQIRADYSASLLRLATHRQIIAGMPLAFGEGDTKGRVMNMAKWKKPKIWVSVVCVLLCVAVLAACALNPAPEESSDMPTVEPEKKAAHGEVTRIPFTVGQLPGGYAYEVDEYGDILFTDGTNTVGGITAYPIPEGVYDPDDDIFLWLEEVGIPDFEDTSLCYMGGITAPKGGWIAEFASDVPEGGEVTVDRRHHFYPIGDRVYDIWFDMILLDYETTEEIRVCVDVSAAESGTDFAAEGSDIVTNMDLLTYGALNMALPEGYGSREEDGSVILSKDGTDVGGIAVWPTPDFDLVFPQESLEESNLDEWVRALGLPEAQESDEPIAYMIENSIYGDLEAEYFHELEPEKLNVEHHFFIDGEIVYDIYYDQNVLSGTQAETFLKTIQIKDEPVAEEKPGEEAAFEKCRAVMEAVESGSYHIRSDIKQVGDVCDVTDVERQYLWHENEEWLNIFDIDPRGLNLSDEGDYTARVAYMYVDGTFYTNEGSAGAAYTDIDWQVDEYPEDPTSPWLASFLLVKANVTYMDTLTDETGECIMFRIDKKYEDKEAYADCYYANFYFDPDGNFLRVRLQVNAFLENEFTVTESIVSLDPDTVAAEIDKEYRRTF